MTTQRTPQKARYELAHRQVKVLHELKVKGRLNLQPQYQRSRVWPDHMKYDLLDTVMSDWPMGVILLNVIEDVDPEGEPIEKYDVVDGQQRLFSLFEYREGREDWTHPTRQPARNPEYKPYINLSPTRQERIDDYEVAVAFMRGYEEDSILDIFSRLQHSRPLRIGEKVKAIRTAIKQQLQQLAEHQLFQIVTSYRQRDANWNYSAAFFKAAYHDNPYERQEFDPLEQFLRSVQSDVKATRAFEATRRILNYERTVLEQIAQQKQNFDEIGSPRLLKWTFAALQELLGSYSLTGREHLVARGVIDYFEAKNKESTDEWVAYVRTGRTGRMDTNDVKYALEQLKVRVINAAEAEPLDTKRYFDSKQRVEIFEKSEHKCQKCTIELAATNFHADHILPHSQGGQTVVDNGQALCSKCNWEKTGKAPVNTA